MYAADTRRPPHPHLCRHYKRTLFTAWLRAYRDDFRALLKRKLADSTDRARAALEAFFLAEYSRLAHELEDSQVRCGYCLCVLSYCLHAVGQTSLHVAYCVPAQHMWGACCAGGIFPGRVLGPGA